MPLGPLLIWPAASPIPGVHNSGWVQSPGAKALETQMNIAAESVCPSVVAAFAKDDRILAWMFGTSPPDNLAAIRNRIEDKTARVTALLPQVFAWRERPIPLQLLPAASVVWTTSPTATW